VQETEGTSGSSSPATGTQLEFGEDGVGSGVRERSDFATAATFSGDKDHH
jgi:hypothetical protein